MDTGNIVIDVLAYPTNSSRREGAIDIIKCLSQLLACEYSIALHLDVRDTATDSPLLADYIQRLIDFCNAVGRPVDPQWILILMGIMKSGDLHVTKYFEACLLERADFLGSFTREAVDRADDLRPVPKALFLALDGSKFSSNNPKALWGAFTGEYPHCIAVEVKGLRESVLHECLHMFGVSEGYDPVCTTTLPGCDSCWMQYNATRGTGLCAKHQGELRDFAAKIKD